MKVNKSAVEAAKELFESMAYEHELDCAVRKVRKLLAPVGCTVEKKGPYVHLVSSRTGSHTLNMARGVRPVSDLLIHAEGFADNQMSKLEPRKILPGFVAVLNAKQA